MLADPGAPDLFDDRVYKRGALTLQALRATVGDDTFFALLRAWVAEREHGSVTTEDFVEAAKRHCGEDLTDLFRRWLYEPERPELAARRPPGADGLTPGRRTRHTPLSWRGR